MKLLTIFLLILWGVPTWGSPGNIFGPSFQTVFVRTNGNDSSVLRGNPNQPALTLAKAITLLQAGDTMDIGPGSYLLDNGSVPPGCMVKGAGRALTFVTNTTTAGHWIFQMTNNLTFRDLNVRMTAGGGASGILAYPFYSTTAGITNITFDNVTAFGDSDVIIAQPSTRSSWTIRNCDFGAFYDTIAIKCTGDGTNSTLFASGSTFHTKGDIENYYGFWIGNGSVATATAYNFSDINHCAILSGFSATTNGFVQGTNYWNAVAPVCFVGCLFLSEDSKTNICIDLGAADDPATPLPTYAYVAGCSFISRYRTNLVNPLFVNSAWPATTIAYDVFVSKGSTLLQQQGPASIWNYDVTNAVTPTIAAPLKQGKARKVAYFPASGSGAPATWGDTIGAEGNSTAFNAPTSSVGTTRDSNSTATTSGIFGDHGNNNYRMGRNCYLATSCQITSTNVERVFIGLTDAATVTAQVASDAITANYAVFRYSTTAAQAGKWQCVTMDNSGTATTASPANVVDTANHLFEVQINDVSTNANFFIDGSLVATITTHLPTFGTNLRWIVGGQTLENVAKTIRWEYVYLESDR